MPGSITAETLNLPGGGRRSVIIYHDDNGPTQLLDMGIVGSNIRLAEGVTPSDTVNNPAIVGGVYDAASFIYIGGAGDVVISNGITTLTFTALAVGVWHPMPPFVRVMLTGTTAPAAGILVGY